MAEPIPDPSPPPEFEPAGGSNGHPRFPAFPVILNAIGGYVGNALSALAPTTQVMTAGQIDFVPFCLPTDFQFDRLQLDVTTGAGGGEATVNVALFANADNKLVVPGGSPLETWSFNPAVSGEKNMTPAMSSRILRGGIIYWVGIGCATAAPTLRAVPLGAALPISHGATASATPNTVLRGAGTLPTIPGTLTPTSLNPYSIRLRRV